jgi:WD40 repeat protein
MAPEQAIARPGQVGPSADVYALGAIVYELLTGRPPFKAPTTLETLQLVVSEEPVPVRRLQSKVPRDLETVCLRCLEKEPHKRYSSAEALAEDLRRFQVGEPVSARPVRWPGRLHRWARRRPAVAGLLAVMAVLVAAGLGGILWAYGEAVAQRNAAQTEADNTRRERARADAQTERAEQKAADERREAKRADDKAADARREAEEARRQEYFAQIGRADARLLVHDHAAAAAALERVRPEDRRNWEYGYLQRQVEGTPLALRGHTARVHSLLYSPDGTRLASVSTDGTKLWDVRSGAEVITLRGATSLVTYSPDGTRLASVAADNTVKLWDARTGGQIATLRGHARQVTAVCFSPDGGRLATASNDKTVMVWDTHNGSALLTLRGHSGPVTAVCFGSDGSRLASASWDSTVKVWDARSGAEILSLRGHGGPVSSVRFSPDASRLVSAGGELRKAAELKSWDAPSGAEVFTLRAHANGGRSVAYSPDGTRLATIGEDGQHREVTVWDAHTGTLVLRLRGHTKEVAAVYYSPDGMRLASASEVDPSNPGEVKLWDAYSGAELLSVRGSICASFSPDGMRLASVAGEWGKSAEVKVWDPRGDPEVLTIHQAARPVIALSYSADGTRLASSALEDKTIRVWDALSGAEIATLRGHTGRVDHLCLSPDGWRLASETEDGTVRLWDVRSGTKLATLRGHIGSVISMVYSPDSKRLATGSGDRYQPMKPGEVRIWDAQSGAEVATLRGHAHSVTAVCYSPDGTRLASASLDGAVKVWDVQGGTELSSLRGLTGMVRTMVYSPDGNQLACASGDWDMPGEVKIWDIGTGAPIFSLQGHTLPVTSLCYSPDGARLASTSNDKTVKVWDTAGGTEILSLRKHTEQVAEVRFTADGTRLAGASYDGTIKLWDARCGVGALTLRGHSRPVNAVSYSPVGTHLASASNDQTVKVWDSKSGAEVATLRGHTHPVTAVAYSRDGSRIVTTAYSATGTSTYPTGESSVRTEYNEVKVWEARTGKLLPGEPAPHQVVTSNVSPDSTTVAVPEGNLVRLWPRRPAPGRYDPWEEDNLRRTSLAAAWQAQEAATAEKVGDTFATAFHRRWLAERFPGDRRHWAALAQFCRTRGDWSRAFAACERLLAREPDLAPVYLEQAYLRLTQDDKQAADANTLYALALAAHTRVGWPDFASAEAEAGATEAAAENWGRARIHSERAALWQPREPEHLWRLALVQLPAGDIDACRDTLQRLYMGPCDVQDMEVPVRLSAVLTAGLQAPVTFSSLVGPLVADAELWQQGNRRASVAARAACLFPDAVGSAKLLSGVMEPQELLLLAGRLVAADPHSWESHEILGAALYRANQPREAVPELEEAIRLHESEGSPWARFFLALSRRRLGQNWSHSAGSGSWEDGVVGRRLRSELGMPIIPADVENKLPAVLAGRAQPVDAGEAVQLARLCAYYKRLFLAAARLYAYAFAANPRLTQDIAMGHRYDTACCAALAASGRGHDAAALGPAECARLRQTALNWLRADLENRSKRVEGGQAADRATVVQRMRQWQQDADLAGVRDRE